MAALINPVKQRLQAGETAVGTMVQTFNVPATVSIAAAAGAEFLMLDMEHTSLSTDQFATLAALAKALGVAPMVRAPSADYPQLSQLLDMGAMGVMLPSVGSAEQAAAIVRRAKYKPEGERGTAFGIAHDDYQPGNPVETMRAANAGILLIAQIETAEGIENVDAIAAVPGIDVLWIGHNDLTTSLGIPGQFDHPRYRQALADVIAACERHGKIGGFRPDSVDHAKSVSAQGFRALALQSDLAIYRNGLKSVLQGFGEYLTQQSDDPMGERQ
jgi:2-dehydro-3-deoxyglucarate aldolase/4-hydroxy-2-oxoheptanedioate aldolase